jgi:phosphoesterase RecJ-like protein
MDEIITLLDAAPEWLVLTHEKPDGDTLGCAVALTRLGRRLGKRVRIISPDPYPAKYAFLARDVGFEVLSSLPSDFPESDGIIACVDTSTAARSYPQLLEHPFACKSINIDHHADNELYGDVNWIDPSASATGEMVTILMEASPWGICQAEAEALYVAVVSDNGSFSFESTTLKSHHCAMAHIKAGVSPRKIADELNSDLSEAALHLWGRAMTRASVFADGACAIYWLTADDFSETGTAKDATENLVNFLLRVRGVKMAALCSEMSSPDGASVRVSLRARPPFNAREVARVFGGGGHDLASGCTINSPVGEAVSALRDEMTSHVSRVSARR